MTIYKIKYNYDTGDSFKNEPDQEGILEFTWTNLDIAKANLLRIKEHYELYKMEHKNSNWFSSKKEEKEFNNKIKEFKKKDWHVKEYDTCIKLMTDNGNFCQFIPEWIGYFERLNWAEIIEENLDRKVSFS